MHLTQNLAISQVIAHEKWHKACSSVYTAALLMGQTSDRVISMTTRKALTNTDADSLEDQAPLTLQDHQKWVLWLLQTSPFSLPPRWSSTLVQERCPLHLPFFLLWKRGQQQFPKQGLYTRKEREAVKATHPTQDLTVTGKLGPRLPSLSPPFKVLPSLRPDFLDPADVTQSLPALLLRYLALFMQTCGGFSDSAHLRESERTPPVFSFLPCPPAWSNSLPWKLF